MQWERGSLNPLISFENLSFGLNFVSSHTKAIPLSKFWSIIKSTGLCECIRGHTWPQRIQTVKENGPLAAWQTSAMLCNFLNLLPGTIFQNFPGWGKKSEFICWNVIFGLGSENRCLDWGIVLHFSKGTNWKILLQNNLQKEKNN